MGLDRTEQIEIIEEVLQRMDQCAEDLRALDDRQIEAYCLADFEGAEGGWLGHFVLAPPAPLRVLSAGEPVATVRPQDHDDVTPLLDLGVPLEVTVADGDAGTISLRLDSSNRDPDAP